MNDAKVTSTIDGSKWHHGISADGLTKLRDIADSINNAVQSVVTEATKAQIKIGRLLVEARDLFPGDEQFGKWRQANTTIGSKESANKLMNLARQCGTGRLTEELVNSLPISTLKELLTAPDSVIQKVTEQVEAGKPPSKTETREMVKESRTVMDDLADLDAQGRDESLERAEIERAKAKVVNVKGPSEPNKPPVQSHYDSRTKAVDSILKMKLVERVKLLSNRDKKPYQGCLDIEWAWMVIGLDPSPAYMHCREAVEILINHYRIELDGPFIKDLDKLNETLDSAVDFIDEEYKNA